jgi:arylsulfatase A-like enzyme
VGSEAAIAGLESSAKNLAAVVKALEEKGVLDKTDIFVVSDHGFSTIDHGLDIIESLKRSKLSQAKNFRIRKQAISW